MKYYNGSQSARSFFNVFFHLMIIFCRYLFNQFQKIISIWNHAKKKKTIKPGHIWDYLDFSGTVALFLIIFQFITGIMLLFYYEPYTMRAFSSIVTIRNDVTNGMLILNLHSLGAKLILFIAFIHFFKIIISSSYRGPRSPQWYSGIGILGLLLFTGFSGYLLPWSQQSYWACVIGTESLKIFPYIGNILASILLGGDSVSEPTLNRFYFLHIIILPLGLLVLIWLHIKWVWGTRVAAPPEMVAVVEPHRCAHCGQCLKACPFDSITPVHYEKKVIPYINELRCNACRACMDICPTESIFFEGGGRKLEFEPIVPQNLFRRATAVWFVFIIYWGGAYFFPEFSKIPADPLTTPENIKPDWYFLASYQVLKILPNELWGILVLFFISLFVTFLPLLDREGIRNYKKRPIFLMMVALSILLFILFTIWGFLS